jgi:hypothetical protein
MKGLKKFQRSNFNSKNECAETTNTYYLRDKFDFIQAANDCRYIAIENTGSVENTSLVSFAREVV